MNDVDITHTFHTDLKQLLHKLLSAHENDCQVSCHSGFRENVCVLCLAGCVWAVCGLCVCGLMTHWKQRSYNRSHTSRCRIKWVQGGVLIAEGPMLRLVPHRSHHACHRPCRMQRCARTDQCSRALAPLCPEQASYHSRR